MSSRNANAVAVSERDLGWNVHDVARLLGWRVYHTFDSRRSEPGFPDEVLVRGGRLIFAELKSAKGKTTAAQEEWLAALRAVPGVEVHVWRPSDMDEIAKLLR